MKLSPSGLLEHARSPEGRKQLRYVGVSLVFVPLGQILIQVIGLALGRNYTAASIISAAILTLPNFFANKRWVWRVTSKENQRTQIAVFWVAAMLGVTFATGLTYLVEKWVKSAAPVAQSDQASVVLSLAVVIAQLVGFGIVWVIRYLVLDRWLFKATHHGDEPDVDEVDDLHHEFPI